MRHLILPLGLSLAASLAHAQPEQSAAFRVSDVPAGSGRPSPSARGAPSTASRSLVTKISDERWASDYAGFASDGSNDAAKALQAAVDDCPAQGCTIRIPAGTINLGSTIVLRTGVVIAGLGQAPGYANATRLVRTGGGGPMFMLPGTAQLTPGPSTAIGFRDVTLDGAGAESAVILSPELASGRGSWNVDIRNVSIVHGQPAIQAQNGWDWWVRDSSFIACGRMPAAAGTPQGSCIHIQNSAGSYPGAASNSWRIDNNYIDTSRGRGIVFDTSLGQQPSSFMSITNNHFGIAGFEAIYGCTQGSRIAGNLSEGSVAGYPIIHLKGGSGCGFNIVIGNILPAPGTFAIVDEGTSDLIADNLFYIPGQGGAWIKLDETSGNVTVRGNKSHDTPCCNTSPMVADLGTLNSVMWNDGADAVLSSGQIPFKTSGNTYRILTAGGAITLPLQTVAALPPCNTSTQAQIRVVFDAAPPVYNTPVVGGGTAWTTVLCNSTAWVAH